MVVPKCHKTFWMDRLTDKGDASLLELGHKNGRRWISPLKEIELCRVCQLAQSVERWTRAVQDLFVEINYEKLFYDLSHCTTVCN